MVPGAIVLALAAEAIHEMTRSRFPVPDPYLLGSEWALGLTVFHWNGRELRETCTDGWHVDRIDAAHLATQIEDAQQVEAWLAAITRL
jgi:hypothetical protein